MKHHIDEVSSRAGANLSSPIFRIGARMILPIALAVSLYLLWRGHNEPGGGFVGGLVGAVGFTVYGLALGRAAMHARLRVSPPKILACGLLFALASGLPGLVGSAAPFLTHQWTELGGLALGTALIFDIGVYLAVLGAVITLLDLYLET
ncbi:Na(+)/H(+) antiporter subunit B [Verticiella sediminum]|uniref:Na(+)/H(+) antiporter subunit B n=1 Tax=Verticiella sediminum TaxID=1247510 RepID=A0A556AKM4_9BURK|nr:MnhB domain-containing protein [Verticiella sediminum]TSH93447.1 Na(+)/H(+) antiporter subunit B [Verticiella sediminum]